jgi:hypothetical protein
MINYVKKNSFHCYTWVVLFGLDWVMLVCGGFCEKMLSLNDLLELFLEWFQGIIFNVGLCRADINNVVVIIKNLDMLLRVGLLMIVQTKDSSIQVWPTLLLIIGFNMEWPAFEFLLRCYLLRIFIFLILLFLIIIFLIYLLLIIIILIIIFLIYLLLIIRFLIIIFLILEIQFAKRKIIFKIQGYGVVWHLIL